MPINNISKLAFEILTDATIEVLDKRRELLRALVLPATGSLVVSLTWQVINQPGSGSWLALALLVAFYALFAMSCHRIILLGAKSLPNEYGLYWSLRETRFAGWLIVIFVIYTAVSVPLGFAYLYLPSKVHEWQIPWYVTIFITTYFEGRFSMVLPATAVEQRMNLPNSWYLTRGRGLSIAIALFVPAFVMDLISIVTRRLIFDGAPIIAEVVDSILVFPIVAVAVGVLSVTYRKVTFQE